MKPFKIMCDNMGDLPASFYQEHDVRFLSLTYTMEDVTYDETHTLRPGDFYAKMRLGAMPTTSQINPEHAKQAFQEVFAQGYDILCLTISSGLSGTYQSCAMAARQLQEKGASIQVIDTLSGSMGEGLLLYKAVQMKAANYTMDEIAAWLETNKRKVCHLITVDDLHHLCRGGRISKTSAMLGSMISLKPIIQMDEEGKLCASDKCHGRKKALKFLVERMGIQMGNHKSDIVMIAHADAYTDAKQLADEIQQTYHMETLINDAGPVIGAHTGPGMVALFFLGEKRMR